MRPQPMNELVTWLRAQLDEDERVALACQYREWTRDGASIFSGHPSNDVVDWVYDDGGWDHIALHDPARVLREIESKRRILDEHPNDDGDFCGDGIGLVGCKWAWPCPTVRLLALPYADREGFRDEWRP